MVWSTGVKALDVIKDMNLPYNNNQRIIVNSQLAVPGHPHVYAMGDCACIDTNALPPVA